MWEINQYNPNIVWVHLIWKETELWRIQRNIHSTMLQAWFFPSFSYTPLSSTNDNLFFWLVPLFSPLYQQGQVKLSPDFFHHTDSPRGELFEMVQKYLEKVRYAGKNIDDYSNDITLVSQFSGIMVRRILEWKIHEKEYILWNLFRHAGKGKIKQYPQLEAVIQETNIKSIILELENILSEIIWERYFYISSSEKSFPFVSPWFEFTFQNVEWKIISIVWWYLDPLLLSDFSIQEDYFLFGINANKLAFQYSKTQKENNWRWIPIEEWYEKLSLPSLGTKDILKDKEWNIILQPSKIHLLVRERLTTLLKSNTDTALSQKWVWTQEIIIEGKGDNLIFRWDWKKYFYPNFPHYLQHYFGWKICFMEDNILDMYLPHVDLESFQKLFLKNIPHKKIYVSQEEVQSFLWEDIDLMMYQDELEKRWYSISYNRDTWYIFDVPWYRLDVYHFRHILAEIMFLIPLSLTEKKDIQKVWYTGSKLWERPKLYRDTLVWIPKFLLSNSFYEIPQILISSGKNIFPEIGKIFTNQDYEIETGKRLSTSLISWIVEYIQKECPKLPYKGFSIDHLSDGVHICFFILSQKSWTIFNDVYNFLYTIWWMLWKQYTLTIDNTLQSLQEWQSFLVYEDGEKVWYFWTVSSDVKIRGSCYIAELTIKI